MDYSDLPIEILKHVYAYDSTYHDEFKNKILPHLEISNHFRVGNTHGLVVTPEKYIYRWKYQECINEKHTIVLDKPFGVIATCQCGKVQCFNWEG